MGDTECQEFLHFTKDEIAQLRLKVIMVINRGNDDKGNNNGRFCTQVAGRIRCILGIGYGMPNSTPIYKLGKGDILQRTHTSINY